MNRLSLPLAAGGGVVLALILALLLGFGSSGLASASASPSSGAVGSQVAVASEGLASPGPGTDSGAGSPAPTQAGATPAASTTSGATPAPTRTPRPTAPPTPRPTPKPTPAPTPVKPKIDSFGASPNLITNCNGNSAVTLSWTTTNADRVNIAVDPQGESPLQHIYNSDPLPPDGQLPDLFYGCNPPNVDGTGSRYHEYVVIAYRGSSYTWKSIQVYVVLTP